MASGTNTTPEGDALEWVINHIGEFNHVTGEFWTEEEKLYIHELKQLRQRATKDTTPYRPAS